MWTLLAWDRSSNLFVDLDTMLHALINQLQLREEPRAWNKSRIAQLVIQGRLMLDPQHSNGSRRRQLLSQSCHGRQSSEHRGSFGLEH